MDLLRTMSTIMAEKLGDYLTRCEREVPSLARELEGKEKKLQFIQSSKLAMYEDYREGRLSRDIFMAKQRASRAEKEKLTAAIERIRKQLCEANQEAEKAKQLKQTIDLVRPLREYDPAVVRKLVNVIKVYPGGRVELEFRNRDELATVLLGEEVGSCVLDTESDASLTAAENW